MGKSDTKSLRKNRRSGFHFGAVGRAWIAVRQPSMVARSGRIDLNECAQGFTLVGEAVI